MKYIILKITNLSYQQPFGGFFVATHNEYADPLFVLGEPSSPELAVLAEDGTFWVMSCRIGQHTLAPS